MRVPNVTFKTRVRNEELDGPNPFEWRDLTSAELFGGKNVVLFALPAPSRQPARTAICRAMKSCTTISGHWVLMP